MDPETQKYFKDVVDEFYDSCVNHGQVQTQETQNFVFRCSDILYNKNPGGQLVPIPDLLAKAGGGAWNPLTVRFHSYLRNDTNNPFRDRLLKKDMLERRADDLITILQDLNMAEYVNAVNALVAYQAACAALGNANTVANRVLYKNGNLCTLVCFIMRVALTPDRYVDIQTVRTVQGWGHTCGIYDSIVNLGDTYAGAHQVVQALLAGNTAPAIVSLKQIFCTLRL